MFDLTDFVGTPLVKCAMIQGLGSLLGPAVAVPRLVSYVERTFSDQVLPRPEDVALGTIICTLAGSVATHPPSLMTSDGGQWRAVVPGAPVDLEAECEEERVNPGRGRKDQPRRPDAPRRRVRPRWYAPAEERRLWSHLNRATAGRPGLFHEFFLSSSEALRAYTVVPKPWSLMSTLREACGFVSLDGGHVTLTGLACRLCLRIQPAPGTPLSLRLPSMPVFTGTTLVIASRPYSLVADRPQRFAALVADRPPSLHTAEEEENHAGLETGGRVS